MLHTTMNDYGAKLLIVAVIRANSIDYKRCLQGFVRRHYVPTKSGFAEGKKKICEKFFESQWAEWLCDVVDMTPKHIEESIRKNVGFSEELYEQQRQRKTRGIGTVQRTPEVRVRYQKGPTVLRCQRGRRCSGNGRIPYRVQEG